MYKYPVPVLGAQLGAIYDKNAKRACFSLWAPSSFDVQVNIYRQASNSSPDYTILADFDRATGVWNATFDQVDPENFAYDFSVRTIRGIHTCLDPYAKSMTAFRNDKTAGRGVIVDMDSEKAGKKYAQNATGSFATTNFISLKHYSDAIIYEISVRDFTSSPDSQTNAHGTYEAFIEKIPYIKSLGITHVQLMPVLNFYFNDELTQKYENSGSVHNNNYNWGYDPHSYFSPEGWLSSNPADAYTRIKELRHLIFSCHKAGIGVLLDVVYNHMATTKFLDAIVPGYYFRTNDDGTLKNNSGCGNDTASEMPMMHRLIVDSLVYWTKEYGVDGFRFDLMGLIESSVIFDALAQCRSINPNTLFIGEGWKMYNGPQGTHGMDQDLMQSSNGVAVFSDEFRDIVKAGGLNEVGTGFITGKETDTKKLLQNCLGNPQSYFKSASSENIINYIACHDGLTLHDTISHNCHLAESNPREKAELISRAKLGNFIVLMSRGIAFLHAGQERGRTKADICGRQDECVGRFVRNSYDSSDNINNFVWTLDAEYSELLEYTKRLIAFRKKHNIFRTDTKFSNLDTAQVRLLTGLPETGLVLGYVISSNTSTCSESYIVLLNASKHSYTFNFAHLGAPALQSLNVIFDAKGLSGSAGVRIKKSTKSNAEVDSLSAVILKSL